MDIELMIRIIDVQKTFNDFEKETDDEEAKEQKRLRRLIDGEDEFGENKNNPFMKVVFTYKPQVINLGDVRSHGEMDENETTRIVTDYAELIAKVPYNVFSRIWSTATGRTIKTMDDFKLINKKTK